MPKISEARRDERRQQILDAALRCFSRDGFHATTTADIIGEAGVSQGSLYLYFPTKEDIVVALADDRHQGEAFLNALAQRESDPIRGLALLIELHGRSLSDASGLDARRVGIQGWGEALRNPCIRDSVVEGTTKVREAIVGLIERGQRTGQVRSTVDPDAAARLLIAVFQGLVLQVAWSEAVDLAAFGQTVRGMIGEGLLTPAGRGSWDELTETTTA
jgi:AcrR family transcriptional regulator